MPTDDSTADDYEVRLNEAIRHLDSLPPDVVRQSILDSGALDPAMTVLADLARNSDDAAVREEARRYIEDNNLGLLLIAEPEDTP